MRLLRLGAAGHEYPAVSIDDASTQHAATFDLSTITADVDADFLAADGIARTRAALASNELAPINVSGTRIGAPIARPGKVVCIGLNYRDHAEEGGQAIPAEPVLFMKAPNTVVGPYDDVLIPRASTKTDWEIELGVVIAKTARYLESPAAAREVIAGYVISHDVSEREFQLERGGQWDKGKSCETFNPLGPWLVPIEDITNPDSLRMRLWVNGEIRQDGSTSALIFGVDYVIWYLSQFMVLEPGDLINTGTPAGVALGMPDQPYLKPDDVVELEIDQLGRQRQVFVQA
ncbi:FAA hydrolase family protein [Actinobacteria bacterium YIM 96077]|uniref:2-hydroxyhepta-2,4-diene-1,7-dioate isomerase n=1 Tax=Phytoactinopolyspora halophila TaxID=1981511 RepID=A0A329R3G7_9ACTN|nr:fumarylacetoacetate hydrolase family protein [Phytoactinopolyspora halophila]AYY11485.1 FAA hydrolase family protein [Actinobacteria bacterium YIM 96077]RAW18032.1 2-hydroxyhepta-2,4-diene-1,7-dioate isomerase [Phytoactinopolyspora halophila]